MVDLDVLAARLEARFDCAVAVLGTTTTPRPTGGTVVSGRPTLRTLRGRLRTFRVDTDNDVLGGVKGSTASWLLTVPRHSALTIDMRLVITPDRGDWTRTLQIVGVRGPKSTYVADRAACIEIGAPEGV